MKCIHCKEEIVETNEKVFKYIHSREIEIGGYVGKRFYCSSYKPELVDVFPPPYAATEEYWKEEQDKKEAKRKEQERLEKAKKQRWQEEGKDFLVEFWYSGRGDSPESTYIAVTAGSEEEAERKAIGFVGNLGDGAIVHTNFSDYTGREEI